MNDLKESLLAKAIPIPVTGCYIWTGDHNGRYGHISRTVNGKRRRIFAHRIMCDAGEDEVAMHICDVTFCIAPDHLIKGTQADNLSDMRSKRRHARKLSDEQLLEILTSDESGAALARKFSVSKGTVSMIRTGYYIDPAKRLAMLRGEP